MQRLLPEWSAQRGVFLVWPHPKSDWADRLDRIIPVYRQIAATIARYQPVHILCLNATIESSVREWATTAGIKPGRLQTHIVLTNDTWIRDYGPLSVRDHAGNVAWLDFRFNAWGGKYRFDLDNEVTTQLASQGWAPPEGVRKVGMILEGGSIDINGQGVLLTTSNCLLNNNRNPTLTKENIEANLREQLGVTQVIWLNHGYLIGDDTDAHVDTLVRFCNDNTIIYCSCDDPNDFHYEPLKKMEIELTQWNRKFENIFRLQPCPLPMPVVGPDGARLPATYVNFLIINQAVLVPTYNDPKHDSEALRCISACFPEREIIAIECATLVEHHGSLHCATLQFA